MNHRAPVMVALVMLSTTVAHAATPECPNDELAEVSTTHLKTWDDLYSSYKKFRQCDDGAIAEGYSDFVARTLANRWDELSTLNKLVAKDADFRIFVVRHVDATADFGDLAKTSANAQRRCPRGAEALCAAIHDAAESALGEP